MPFLFFPFQVVNERIKELRLKQLLTDERARLRGKARAVEGEVLAVRGRRAVGSVHVLLAVNVGAAVQCGCIVGCVGYGCARIVCQAKPAGPRPGGGRRSFWGCA